MAVAREWIENCTNKHTNCGKRSTEAGYTPTRLLDVSQAIDKSKGVVTLVDTTKHHNVALSDGTRTVEYATLSHRWNPSYTCFTETSNIDDHLTKGIQINLLPKIFAEACITARKLGLRYIWIDSLCIIQDSNTDKASEIPKMADYYQSAELNLSASTEVLEGLWSDRDGASTRPFKIKATLCLPAGKRKEVVIDLAPVLRTNKSHLDYRGWILQERIFPRRTLFFDAYWLSFECGEMSASESCPRGVRLDKAKCFQLTHNTTIGNQRQILTLWYRILNEYSLRQLSFESDRLDAISGLAARLARTLGDDYIGGIWRHSLLECLQWRPDDPLRGSEATVRQTKYRAPTWSWAS
ncbi:HET-domain-containing protein, partial [Cryphonectria parasitica EP155]